MPVEINEALPEYKRYTYSEYCTWDDGKRWELIDGTPCAMAAPSWKHQAISGELFGQLHEFLKGNQCKVFAAPFDVRLNADSGDDTVVQPDLVVICDRSKLIGTGCIGTPDMTVEILSPSTVTHDRVRKFKLYQQYGVREYWIVDPETKMVSAHILKDGEYIVKNYADTDTAPVYILEGCTINLPEIFAE